VLVVFMIAGLIGLVGMLEVKRQTISAQLSTLTKQMEDGQLEENTEENQQIADRIIAQVRTLINIPEDVEPTVATIIDINLLRERNPFYNKAENGDFLIVTRERAILYSEKENKIIDVAPIQLEPVE
ncbi:MAG: hypothetical protein KC680_02425, partial [Candidatus Peregrinibacteria bacterium]|nr:hypothetical protein [Candidatus Peregrinibacteria bacterium]